MRNDYEITLYVYFDEEGNKRFSIYIRSGSDERMNRPGFTGDKIL
jgi:hypothetical protein